MLKYINLNITSAGLRTFGQINLSWLELRAITCCELLAQDINDYVYTCISRENGIIKKRVRVGRVRKRELDFNLFLISSFTFHIYSTRKRCLVILCLMRRRQVYDDGDR